MQVHILAAWSFDETVRPLFPVPACVLIGRRERAGTLPATVLQFSGDLPRRDAHEEEADRCLTQCVAPWPPIPTLEAASPYRARFRNGASVFPRRFFLIERGASSRLGPSQAAPRVRGKASRLDKTPWKDVEPPAGPVEERFVRPTLLGETLLPFRLRNSPAGSHPA